MSTRCGSRWSRWCVELSILRVWGLCLVVFDSRAWLLWVEVPIEEMEENLGVRMYVIYLFFPWSLVQVDRLLVCSFVGFGGMPVS